MRGFIAQGEFGWNPESRTVEQFITAHARREWGLERRLVTFISEMEQAAFFRWSFSYIRITESGVGSN